MTSAAIRRGMCVGGRGVTSRLGVLIEYVCDAHAPPGPIGPLVTRHDGAVTAPLHVLVVEDDEALVNCTSSFSQPRDTACIPLLTVVRRCVRWTTRPISS